MHQALCGLHLKSWFRDNQQSGFVVTYPYRLCNLNIIHANVCGVSYWSRSCLCESCLYEELTTPGICMWQFEESAVIEPMSTCQYFKLWIGLWSTDLIRLTFVFCVMSGAFFVLSTHTTLHLCYLWDYVRKKWRLKSRWELVWQCLWYDLRRCVLQLLCQSLFKWLELCRDELMLVLITITNCQAWLE